MSVCLQALAGASDRQRAIVTGTRTTWSGLPSSADASKATTSPGRPRPGLEHVLERPARSGPDVAVVKLSSITASAASRTSNDTVASRRSQCRSRGSGDETVSPGRVTRRGSAASAPRCRAADGRIDRRPSPPIASRPRRRAEADALDRREARECRHDLGDARLHRRAAAAVVELPERSTVATPSATAMSRSRVPSGIALARPPARSSDVGPSSSASSEPARRPAWLHRAAHRGDLPVAEEVDGEGSSPASSRRASCRSSSTAPRRRRCTPRRRARRGRAVLPRHRAQTSSCAHRAGQLFGNQDAASHARAANVRPTTGANLNPWPEQADPTTTRPWRSRTKPSRPCSCTGRSRLRRCLPRPHSATLPTR